MKENKGIKRSRPARRETNSKPACPNSQHFAVFSVGHAAGRKQKTSIMQHGSVRPLSFKASAYFLFPHTCLCGPMQRWRKRLVLHTHFASVTVSDMGEGGNPLCAKLTWTKAEELSVGSISLFQKSKG